MAKLHSILMSDRPGHASRWNEASLNSFRAVHADMALTVYSDDALRQLVADDFDKDVLCAYDHCDGASKACLGRYCLLFRYGGIYSDPSLMFVAPVFRSIDSKLHAFRSADANANDVSVSLIAAPANLPLFEKCIHKFVKLTRNHDGDLGSAGPRLFGETISFCASPSKPIVAWGEELRVPSRAGVVRHAYKSSSRNFVAIRQMRGDGDAKNAVGSDPEDIGALLSLLDGWI
jgi:hypothetical protein